MRKAFRVYANGDFASQDWNDSRDTTEHIKTRPECALVVSGLAVYYGQVPSEVIHKTMNYMNEKEMFNP